MAKVAIKSKLLDTADSLTADTTRTTVFDLRGCEDIKFHAYVTTTTGVDANNYFKCVIQGCETRNGTFRDVLSSDKLAVGNNIFPTAADDEEGETVLPRFILVKWDETGTITDFDATVRMIYNRPRRGKQVDHGAISG